MRTWLVRGTRRFVVDPRRRFGRFGGARRLLSNDAEAPSTPHGAWGGLVSALQRHTVHGELAQLSREDRQILSLAYLGGHTNREIAAMLNVSVSTVRRRLSIALARLEESMRRAGIWMAALGLGALGLYNRIAHSGRTTRWPSTVAMVAAGTVSAVTIGVVAVNPPVAQAGAQTSQVRATAPAVILSRFGAPFSVGSTTTRALIDLAGPAVPNERHVPASGWLVTQDAQQTAAFGCHGNPTDAAPIVPVGARGPHPVAPILHPGSGGCGPNAS
jgi:DNA-binding CsgD family transcriptional regulator